PRAEEADELPEGVLVERKRGHPGARDAVLDVRADGVVVVTVRQPTAREIGTLRPTAVSTVTAATEDVHEELPPADVFFRGGPASQRGLLLRTRAEQHCSQGDRQQRRPCHPRLVNPRGVVESIRYPDPEPERTGRPRTPATQGTESGCARPAIRIRH